MYENQQSYTPTIQVAARALAKARPPLLYVAHVC